MKKPIEIVQKLKDINDEENLTIRHQHFDEPRLRIPQRVFVHEMISKSAEMMREAKKRYLPAAVEGRIIVKNFSESETLSKKYGNLIKEYKESQESSKNSAHNEGIDEFVDWLDALENTEHVFDKMEAYIKGSSAPAFGKQVPKAFIIQPLAEHLVDCTLKFTPLLDYTDKHLTIYKQMFSDYGLSEKYLEYKQKIFRAKKQDESKKLKYSVPNTNTREKLKV